MGTPKTSEPQTHCDEAGSRLGRASILMKNYLTCIEEQRIYVQAGVVTHTCHPGSWTEAGAGHELKPRHVSFKNLEM